MRINECEMSSLKQRIIQLKNRHMAKLLTDLGEANCLPSLVEIAIKREMRFLTDDVIEAITNKESQLHANGNH